MTKGQKAMIAAANALRAHMLGVRAARVFSPCAALTARLPARPRPALPTRGAARASVQFEGSSYYDAGGSTWPAKDQEPRPQPCDRRQRPYAGTAFWRSMGNAAMGW